jgi:hypothetical protein
VDGHHTLKTNKALQPIQMSLEEKALLKNMKQYAKHV